MAQAAEGSKSSTRKKKRKRSGSPPVKKRRFPIEAVAILALVGLLLTVVVVREVLHEPLEPAAAFTGVPINQVDPTSGEPIVAGLTSVYKKYTIGHCCVPSQTDWEQLSEREKDNAVNRFLQ